MLVNLFSKEIELSIYEIDKLIRSEISTFKLLNFTIFDKQS